MTVTNNKDKKEKELDSKNEVKSNYFYSKMIDIDPSSLSDRELLEYILSIINPEKTARKVAQNILSEFGTLKNLFSTPQDLLAKSENLDPKDLMLLKACKALTFNILGSGKSNYIGSAFVKENCAKLLQPYFVGLKNETMYIMLIDRADRIIDIFFVAKGSSSRISVDNKHIINLAVKYNAAKVLLAHNHFTGPEPSSNDIILTSKLEWLLGHMGIELCDHLIFFEDGYHSMLGAGEMTSIGYNLIISGNY